MKIGIPQALGYYYYYPVWKSFFDCLGIHIVKSDPTNQKILEIGNSLAPAETCLPLKCYIGHVTDLLNKADLIFIPRLVCLSKRPETKLNCPKFLGLPDIIRALLPESKLLAPVFDLRIRDAFAPYKEIAHLLGVKNKAAKLAFNHAKQQKLDQTTYRIQSSHDSRKLLLGLIGHPYLTGDEYLSLNLKNEIQNLGCTIIEPASRSYNYIKERSFQPVCWQHEEEILLTASQFFNDPEVDGIVYLLSFGCGAASITSEIIEFELRGHSTKPVLKLVIDEHIGKTDLYTRLESFIDMIKLRKGK